jgi:hypothetical protein
LDVGVYRSKVCCMAVRTSSMQRFSSAALANSYPVQGSIECVQGAEQGLRFCFTALSPKTFSHLVQGQDGLLDISSRCRVGIRWLFLGH